MTVRRLKTYTANTGYVYQYYFVGKRPVTPPGHAAEYIFDVSSDRKTVYPVTVILPESTLKAWATVHSRSLTDAEQYAAVKMRLFQAFDEIENLEQHDACITVDSHRLETALNALGVQ